LKVDRKALLPVSPKGSALAVAEIAAPPKLGLESTKSCSVDLEHIKSLSDAGQFDEALALCKQYLDQKGQAAEVYYLLALISDAKGESERAIGWYRKVLYLEPGHSDALMHLALLYERAGNTASAKRLRGRALRSEATGHRNPPRGETVLRRGQ
jgi:chemotaxis protein methyltransferase WspC